MGIQDDDISIVLTIACLKCQTHQCVKIVDVDKAVGCPGLQLAGMEGNYEYKQFELFVRDE